MAVNYINRGMVLKFSAAVLGLGVVATAAGVTLGERAPQPTTKHRKHICLFPEFDPSTSSGCTEEINAYAAAVAALQDAQDAADEAYDAWYECENGGAHPTDRSIQISQEYSVLQRD